MTADRDIKTTALVLRRTNLGEADRLLDLLTPDGRFTVLAKASRREKSRLAGGIELFCLSDIQIHHSAKSNRNILSSAKMKVFYRHILEDFSALDFASTALKQVDRASRDVDSPRYFEILNQLFAFLDQTNDLDLAYAWFYLNLKHLTGDEINLIFDIAGQKLSQELTYSWDPLELAFRPSGPITANHIKLLRLILVSPITLVAKIKNYQSLLPEILPVARSLAS